MGRPQTVRGFSCRWFMLLAVLMLPVKGVTLAKDLSYYPTSTKEIERWQDLPGGQYVLGSAWDSAKARFQPLAIYDKTLRKPFSRDFWTYLSLGSLGVANLNAMNLVEKISRRQKRKNRRKVGRLVSELLSGGDDSQARVYPPGWWQNPKVRFLSERCPTPDSAPQEIFLKDLDWKGTSATGGLPKKSLLEGLMKRSDGPGFEPYSDLRELLGDSKMVRREDGFYELHVDPRLRDTPPGKVIDLRGKNSSYKQALGFAAVNALAKAMIVMVPAPFLVSTFAAMFERFFTLIEVKYLTHHTMALNLVVDAQNGDPKSPFFGVLSTTQLDDAIVYLRRTSTMISALMRNAVAKRAKMGKAYQEKLNQRRVENLQYLEKKDYRVYPFGKSFYALASKRDEQGELKEFKIFSLVKRKLFRRRPVDLVDFLHPQKELTKRSVMEALLIGTNYVYLPVPIVVSVVKILYKEIFIREIHRRQMQEAGLRGYVNHNPYTLIRALKEEGFSHEDATSYVEKAYKIIDDREMNPMTVSRAEDEDHRRRVERWLLQKDEQYTPWQRPSVNFY